MHSLAGWTNFSTPNTPAHHHQLNRRRTSMLPMPPVPAPPTTGAAATAVVGTVESSSSSRRNRMSLAVAGCVLVAGAIIAGVLGSNRPSKSAASSSASSDSLNTKIMYDNVLESLLAHSTLPVPNTTALPTVVTSPPPPANEASTAGGNTFSGSSSSGSGSVLENALDGIKDMLAGNKQAIGAAPPGSLSSLGWGRLGAGNIICYPKNGTEVVSMTDGKSPCTVIVLTRSSTEPYNIRQTINITSTKIIVGNPIDLPALNASNKIERLFRVYPGGRLDVRFASLYRGAGRRVDGGFLKLTIGGTVYVDLEGSFTATGCLFREQRQTVASFLEDVPRMFTHRSRNYGGTILVIGGQLYLQGCTFLRFRPFGSAVLNSAQIGRDILLIAGNLALSGVYNMNANLFGNNVVVGNTLAVLGGTAVWAGGATCNVAGAQSAWGAGFQMFVGGGVLISAGFQYISCNGALMRGAFGLFSVGGGLHLQTGYLQSRVWAVGSTYSAGQTFSVGGGIHQMIGGAIATTSIANVFFGAGGGSFVGSGQMRWIGVAQAHSALVQSQYGVGFSLYNGAGTVNVIYVTQASTQLARAQFGVGNYIFLGAGWLTSVNTTRFAAQLVNSFHGQGSQIYVGAGGAVFIRCYTVVFRGYGYSSTKNLYTIAGTGVSRTEAQRNIVVTKEGQTLLAWQPKPKGTRMLENGVMVGEEEEEEGSAEGMEVGVDGVGGLFEGVRNAFVDPEGKSKLIVIQSMLEERKQVVIEDATPFEAKELKSYWGGLAQILADGAVTQGRGKALETTKGTIFVNNTNCFICSVGPGTAAEHMTGPSSCVVSDACSDSDSPASALASAKEAAKAAAAAGGGDAKPFDLSFPEMSGMSSGSMGRKLAEGEIELPDVWMLWHEMTVYCHTTDPSLDTQGLIDEGCVSEDYVKDIVRAYLGPAYTRDDFQLAVASAGVHDAVKALVEEPLAAAMAPAWNADCEGWTKFNIYITASDPAVEKALTQEWEAIVNDPSDFQTTLLQNSDASAKIKPCSMLIRRVATAKYPSLQNMKGFKPLNNGMSLIGPSLTVASEAAIVPVTELVEGQTYKLYVQNFMKGSQINVFLIKGLERTGPVVATIADFDDSKGMVESEWMAPVGLEEASSGGKKPKYYLTASVGNFPAFFANSQAFTIVPVASAARKERRM